MQAKGLVVKAPGDDSPDLIPVQVLKRMAVVCVRPSTQTRVMTNLQSERQHYDLVDIARQHGLADIKFIDDDLGRTASGTLARLPPPLTGPSDALIAWWRGGVVAWSCAGKVGAVLCLDASRLARKGRGWRARVAAGAQGSRLARKGRGWRARVAAGAQGSRLAPPSGIVWAGPKPASSTTTASAIPVSPMTACSWA